MPRLDDSAIRRQAARSLAELFDSLYEGAFAIDTEGRITWMNDKFKALIGWNGIEPVEGRQVEEIVPHSELRRVVETGRGDLLDIWAVGDRQITVSRLPLLDDQGRVSGALGVVLYDRLQALKPIVGRFQRMQSELQTTRQELAQSRRARYSFASFVGGSEKVRELKRQARRAAEREMPVLLLGETGTGKELLAHAIHAASPRAEKPMVRVNIAAIPETLLEAELFGAAPGAFTGADRKGREGKLKLADGGTLFLDEVGDMPPAVQAKLLRVLQEQEFEPLGSNKMVRVDVRVISATSRDLRKMMDQGSFRADLFYRLNVLPLHLPPLRERLDDLDMLCEVILDDMAGRGLRCPAEVSQDGLARLACHDWPGNVRELRNVLEQAAARQDSDSLSAAHFENLLPPADQSVAPRQTSLGVTPLREALLAAEREAFIAALHAAKGVKSQAAKLLGISRAQFYEKLAHHDLSEIPDNSADLSEMPDGH